MRLIYIGRSRLHRNRANLIQTLHTVQAIKRLGIQVTLFLPPWKKGLNYEQRLRQLGVNTGLDIRVAQSLHSRWRIWPFIYLHKSLLKHADAILTRSPEISLALSRAQLPHYFELHEIDPLEEKKLLSPLIQAYNKKIVKWILPISHAAANELKLRGAEPGRILVNPCGVDVGAFRDICPFDPANLSCPRILYAGRIGNRRGLEILKNIARQKIGTIIIAGEEDKDFLPEESIKILPHIPHRDVPRLYGESEIVLLPYQKELPTSNVMSPLKLFEAMAAGRPIIASDLPPIREILQHEVNSLLVEPDNIQAWIAAIRKLTEDPQLALRLAQALRQKAPQFDWEKRARRIISIISCGSLP